MPTAHLSLALPRPENDQAEVYCPTELVETPVFDDT